MRGLLGIDLLAQASTTARAGPDIKADPDLKVRTALNRAAARIAGKFEKQPLVGCGLAAARARCRASGYADQHE
jgi:hypothetical protein